MIHNMQNLFIKLPSLQFFAAGDNNDQPVRRFERRYRDLLPTVFNKKAYFGDFSAGGIEVLDGVTESATAFTIKTIDIPVTIGTYNTGANVGFGTGSDATSRFGQIKEVVSVNTDVPYASTWAFREGLDRFTVNDDFQAVVARRLAEQAEAQTRFLDQVAAAALVANAGETETLAGYTDAAITTLFNDLYKHFLDLEVDINNVVAKVDGDLYNAIVNGTLAVTGKGSTVNIDANGITRFKGIQIVPVPAGKLPAGQAAVVYPINIGKLFVGITTARTFEVPNFDGIELQGAGKYGTFVLNDNKKAIVKVTAPTPPGP